MATVILYAVEIAEMERWVGSRDASLLREAKALIREDDESAWEREELEVLDRLLERVIQEGQLYEGLGEEESYYLTQILIDLFDELAESEAVSEEMPLDAFTQALAPLRSAGGDVARACDWLVRGRLLGTDRTARGERLDEDALPYFGYVRRGEIAPLAAAAAAASGSPSRGRRSAPRGRADNLLERLAAGCRECLDTERDLLSLVG